MNAQNQEQSLDTALLQNEQYTLTNKIIETLDLNGQAGYISLNDQKYLINYVPFRQLSVVILDNKGFYQQKLDSLSVLLSNTVDKDLGKGLKAQIKEYKELKKNSPKYRTLGIKADSLFSFYSLESTARASMLSNSKTFNVSDPVVPIYIVGGQVKDTLVVLNMAEEVSYGEGANRLLGFLLSDLNPAQIEKRRKEKEAKDRQQQLAKIYNSNPLYTDKKDWTLDVFKDTTVYLHKYYYKTTKWDLHEVENPVYKVVYRISNAKDSIPLNNYEDKIYNSNLNSNEYHEYSHTEILPFSLMELWVAYADKSSSPEYRRGVICDTLYSMTYPSNVLNEIFEAEFEKRSFNSIKYVNFKETISKSTSIDTSLVYITSDYSQYGIKLRLRLNAKNSYESRNELTEVEVRIGENGYSISLDGTSYDTRLGVPKYELKESEPYDQEWKFWFSSINFKESLLEEWFNYKYENAKEYYKEKLVQQEEEKKQMQKLYSKYGTKYVKAAEEFEVIVGMHEDLLAYSLKLWKIDRRSRTSNGYTLYCYSILDTSVRLVVTVTNSKVSYVSY